MFDNTNNSRQQGDVGLTAAIYYFTLKGWDVCLPITDNQPYDLVVYSDKVGFKKVQVKTSNFQQGNMQSSTGLKYYHVKIGSTHSNSQGTFSKHFNKNSVDYLFILTGDGQFWLIPTDELDPKSQIRLGPTYNKYKV
jgi:hypothetical protein